VIEHNGGAVPDGSVVTVPPAFTKDAVFEAIENGIELIVIVTERIPRRDVAQMVELANLRGARLSGSDFSYAKLRGADLSESDLRGAKFVSADAVEAIFIRADLTGAIMTSIDLMQGLLQKAKIRGADFQGANLFRVDLAKVEADASTNFTNANVKYVRVVPRGEHG